MNKAVLRLAGFAVAGVAQAVSIAAPWSGQPLWWLQILSLTFLVWQLDTIGYRSAPRAWREGLGYGWVFSTAWLCGVFWWLFISLHTYGGLAAPLTVIAVFALAAGLALYYAIACALFAAFAPASRAWSALLFVALWLLGELLRNTWFTGFPWGAGGYAHVDGPLAPAAGWVGAYGIGALASAIAAALAMTLRRPPNAAPITLRRLAPLAAAALLLTVPTLLKALSDIGSDATLGRGKLGIALLQGNIPQNEKFVPGGGVATALRWYGAELASPRASLTITPETAIPLLPSQLPAGYLQDIADRYATGNRAAIIGIPIGNGDSYSNALLGFQPGQTTAYRYDKHHLVPFGEFVPGVFRWFTNLMDIPLGDFRRGGLGQAPFLWQGQRIAPNICYEDLFGDEIGANFRDDASSPTILLNVSNIAWFGDSLAIDEHLSISRMRALEFARPMVRATNTGATVVIDHRGRVTHQLPRLTRGVLEAEVEGRAGRTPFARWVSVFGLWPFWIGSLAVVGITLLLHRRRSLR